MGLIHLATILDVNTSWVVEARPLAPKMAAL